MKSTFFNRAIVFANTLLFSIVLAACGVSDTKSDQSQSDWENLISGNALDNWEMNGGSATYELINGEIIGTAVPNSPNTFLCTKKKYSDFILEYELYSDNVLNSGVQFRSAVNEKGRVYGYQCEMDPSERRFTGGIYDEGRRGWLYPLSRNEKSRNAYKHGSWNKFRIECLENDIRTYVNGQLCAWLVDDASNNGFIGLQVHGIGRKEEEGLQVKWRDIKIVTSDVKKLRNELPSDALQIGYLTNELTDWEKKNGFELLFDGEHTDQFKSADGANFPNKGWMVENDALTLKPQSKAGDIVTKEKYENFELCLEFNLSKKGNSGVKYFVDATEENGDEHIGCEFQILDDRSHPDAKQGINGNRTLASLYDLIPAGNLNTEGRAKQFKGLNRWNQARIVVNGNQVEHWLNNELAVSYDRTSSEFKDAVKNSKFKSMASFGTAKKGRILLQDHNDEVSFRNIKIRKL